MKKFFLSLLSLLMLSCVTQERVQRAELIAHAGGAIEGNVYTNSREALELAVENGYKFIEFDLIFTSDSVLVAAHSWGKFNMMTGCEEWGDSVPSFMDFTSRRIHGEYTPLCADEINSFFEENDELFLVTDKVSDPDVLRRYFPALKERMVVEAFSYQHYRKLINEGYYRVLYSCMAHDISATLLKHLLFNRIFPGERVEWVALDTSGYDNWFFKFLNKMRRFNVALFTVDSPDSIAADYRDRAKMIYTNNMLPEN